MDIQLRTTRVAAAAGFMTMMLACATGVSAQDGSGIQWSVTPYIWAPTTTVDLSFRDASVGGQIDFKDLLDAIDAAFMIHVEGGRGQWSAFADLTYLDASDTDQRTLLTVETRSKQVMLDAAVSWWPGGVGTPLSVFGGLRHTGFDDRYDFRSAVDGTLLASRRSEKDYYDALLGLRYTYALSPRWALLGRGDVSFGDSEGTFLLRGMLAYTVGKRQQNRILFGYQYKEADFEDGELKTEYGFSGVLAGFNFRF